VRRQTSQHQRTRLRSSSMTPAQKQWVSRAELERYKIVAIPLEVFEWGGYRYTNAHDALAAAKRATVQ